MHKGAKSAKWPTHWWYFSGPVDETKERPVTRERCFLDLIFLVDSNKDQLMFRSPSFLHIFAFAAAGSNVLVVVSHALMMHWPFRIISQEFELMIWTQSLWNRYHVGYHDIMMTTWSQFYVVLILPPWRVFWALAFGQSLSATELTIRFQPSLHVHVLTYSKDSSPFWGWVP